MIAVNCHGISKYFFQWQRKNGGGKRGLLSRMFSPVLLERTRIHAVRDINLEVRKGEIFGILGANGSGKSTLIRMISTLLIPDEGTLEVYGHDVVRHECEVRRIINRVSADAAFFKKLSAWENLSYTARLYGIEIKEARGRISAIMERLGFSDKKLNESIENLSRGMQQKVAIARALLTSPRVLLLDEPTTGLDPKSRRQVQEFVAEINREDGITTILTTHDMEEAERLCHRIAIMKEGRMIAAGTPSELKRTMKCSGDDKVTLEKVFMKLAQQDDED